MEHFSALPQTNINSTVPSHQRHTVFHSFISGNIKQYAATTTTHSKRFYFTTEREKTLITYLSTIWENSDGCAEQYRFDSAL